MVWSNPQRCGAKKAKKDEEKKQRDKKLLMAEDFLSNVRWRIKDVINSCAIGDVDIEKLLPPNDTEDDKVYTYQHILLYVEILRQHIKGVSMENQKLNAENTRLKDGVKAMGARNKKLEESIEKLRDDYTFLSNKFEVTKKQLCKTNEKLERMKKECEATEKLLKENLNLKKENNELKLNLQEIEDDYEQEKASLEEVIRISDENLYLNNKIDILGEENKNLKQDLRGNITKANELTFKNKSLESLVQKMKRTIKQKSKELHNKNDELITLKEKVNSFEEVSILNYNLKKSYTQTTYSKNVLSNSFLTSLQEVYSKMEDIDNFIYRMMEKENRPSKNVFRDEDVCVDVGNKIKT